MNILVARIPPKIKLLSYSAITVVALVLVWYFITASGAVKPIFLPSPAQTFKALVYLLVSGKFFQALWASLLRIILATILGVIVGCLLGIGMGLSKKIHYALNPITEPLRYLPISALIPIMILWFGIGEQMKIMFLFVAVLSYFIPLVSQAVARVPQQYIDVARSFGASRSTIIRTVYFKYALPRIFEGLIVVNAIGWNYIILAEIINAQSGLGYLINIAGRLSRSDEVFAGLILISAVAIISHYILRYIHDKYFFW